MPFLSIYCCLKEVHFILIKGNKKSSILSQPKVETIGITDDLKGKYCTLVNHSINVKYYILYLPVTDREKIFSICQHKMMRLINNPRQLLFYFFKNVEKRESLFIILKKNSNRI